MNNKILNVCRNIRGSICKHSPEIFTGLGISSMVASTILAVKATPKAVRMIEEEDYRRKEPTPAKDICLLVWKEYLPAISFGLGGIVLIICGCAVNKKRTAALATAYTMSERAFLTYKDKVIETIGEKKEKEIKDKVAEDEIKNKPLSANQVIITPKGNTLILDSLSGRYFRSDLDKIKRAVNDLNRSMTYNNYISLNEWYSEIGLEGVRHGDDMGWNLDDGLINISYGAQLAENDEPCVYLDYDRAPKPNFNKLF